MISSHRQIIKTRRGQTLIIALMVMFILATLATVFIALVARNLARSSRMSSTDAVASIAEAGVRYADEMLTTSEDGADWRPIPDNLDTSYADNDPDYQWLRPYDVTEAASHSQGPTGGYTRFNCGDGRFLLRVSYNPDPDVPMSKYIKIEAIGRWGTIDINDPTTLHDASNLKLRREITAYKPIGITDSCRFITNKDNRTVDVALGVPGYVTNYGRSADTSRYGVRGGPIRVNANLLWYGNYTTGNTPSVNIFLRGIQTASDLDGSIGDLTPIDNVEVSGDIKVDSDPTASNATSNRILVALHELIKNPGSSPTTYTDTTINVLPSTDDDINGTIKFITANGFYRDGRNTGDASITTDGDSAPMPRGVKRIEPPLVDQPDPTNTTTRYRSLTLNSGERISVSGNNWFDRGRYGWGKGIYINNTNDKQDESETLFGGITARADFMQPGNMMTTNWKGPYYVPPAVTITLVPNDSEQITNGSTTYTQYYFTITRDDAPSGRKAVWYDAGGNPRQDWGSTVRMPYPDPVNGRTIEWNASSGTTTHHIDGNGVIYAEGNIRIRGMLPPGMKLTVVSNQNIYIDGSVLKNRPSTTTINPSGNYRGADPTCGIALLARQNIVVNTTQFFAPLNTIGADDYGTDSITGGNSGHVILRNTPDSRLRCMFDFAPYESESNLTPSEWYLFLRHTGEFGPAYINAWLNPSNTVANWGMLNLNRLNYGTLPPHVWGVGDPRFGIGLGQLGAGLGSSFLYNVFTLTTSGVLSTDQTPPNFFTMPGMPNILQIALDQTAFTRNNYWMGGMAVTPMDVRIEAILYAQEGSFYVIPGYWLNPNSADTEQAFNQNNHVRPAGVSDKFPFYGQAPDIRIIVDGAVSENLPASISDVEEWMAKWGKIPEYYGSSNSGSNPIHSAHKGEGITFLYDDHVGWPLDDSAQPVRKDSYGRALPLTPKLPVSGSLIYFGDVM